MTIAEAAHADDFAVDLRRALAVWPRQPLVPLISMLFWTLSSIPSGNEALDVAWAVVAVLLLGWPGTEREWYRRAFAGESFPASEIWPTTRRFFARFFRLVLLASPLGVLYLVAFMWLNPGTTATLALTLAIVFIIDVLFTFVTPALTFTTHSARRAVVIGLAMLRAHWPAAAPYAMTPALVVILGTQALIEPVVGPAVGFVATAIAGLFALALKGATVAFYLRHPPTLSS